MHKNWILTALTVSMFACTTEQKTNKISEKQQSDTSMKTGNDADEHGCKPSTGYTWSVIKNDCIRIWESGTQLQPIGTTSEGEAQFIACAIVSEDHTQAELFLKDIKGSILLESSKTSADTYTHADGYELSVTDKRWELKKNGKLIYIKK